MRCEESIKDIIGIYIKMRGKMKMKKKIYFALFIYGMNIQLFIQIQDVVPYKKIGSLSKL